MLSMSMSTDQGEALAIGYHTPGAGVDRDECRSATHYEKYCLDPAKAFQKKAKVSLERLKRLKRSNTCIE